MIIENASGAERDVLVERRRQKSEEGWTLEHDDEHVNGEMASAAAAYAIGGNTGIAPATIRDHLHAALWPWSPEWWKPRSNRRNLVRAAALIIAEIERIDRKAIAEYADKVTSPTDERGNFTGGYDGGMQR